MATQIEPAGEDVLDRLPATPPTASSRGRAWSPSATAPSTTRRSSSRAMTDVVARIGAPPRRAVRRQLGGRDVLPRADDAAARDGRALGRRRRRDVRRLPRATRPRASRTCTTRSPTPLRPVFRTGRARGRAGRGAARPRATSTTSATARPSATRTSCASSRREEKRALYNGRMRAAIERAPRPTASSACSPRATASSSPRAPHRSRLADVPRRRHQREGRHRVDGARARGAVPVPRHGRRRVRGAPAAAAC